MALLGGMDAEAYQWKSCGINGCEEMNVMLSVKNALAWKRNENGTNSHVHFHGSEFDVQIK